MHRLYKINKNHYKLYPRGPWPNKECDKVSTPTQELDPSILKSFLQTCMKLLRSQRVVEGLQELIDFCGDKEVQRSDLRTMNNLHRHKKRTGKEMRLTAQIGEYDMDQVIVNLGSNANVLPNKTWELMGRTKLQWSLIQLTMANQ